MTEQEIKTILIVGDDLYDKAVEVARLVSKSLAPSWLGCNWVVEAKSIEADVLMAIAESPPVLVVMSVRAFADMNVRTRAPIVTYKISTDNGPDKVALNVAGRVEKLVQGSADR